MSSGIFVKFLAAHCTYDISDPGEIRALVGAHNFNGLHFEVNSAFLEIESIANHPGYNNVTIDYDYAILTLKDDLVFNYGVKEICMPR